MYYSRKDLTQTDRIKRLNLINSITGIKPGNLIGTRSAEGISNLAIISSVVHLGSDPPLLGYVTRPDDEVKRHTLENIKESGVYTINHIRLDFIENAHYTSAKFDSSISEFDRCGFTEDYQYGFEAPFVKESTLKMGLVQVESIPIKSNGTMLVIGEIQHLVVPEQGLDERGMVGLDLIDSVGIGGLNSYYSLKKMGEYPYARVDQVPKFGKE